MFLDLLGNPTTPIIAKVRHLAVISNSQTELSINLESSLPSLSPLSPNEFVDNPIEVLRADWLENVGELEMPNLQQKHKM